MRGPFYIGFFLSVVSVSAVTVRSFSQSERLVIVGLGDSTTAGTPFFKSPLESPPHGQGDPEGQYAYWMMRRHPDWKVVNCGIRGQRSDEIRARFDDTLAREHPHYLIVLAGVNDVFQDYPLDYIESNLAWMYSQAQMKGVIAVAATVLPYNSASPVHSKEIDTLNHWIKSAAEKYRIPLADLHQALADPNDPTKLNGSPDGLHPDVGGYRKMGKILTEIIEEMEAHRPH